jgi:hypothetical protein
MTYYIMTGFKNKYGLVQKTGYKPLPIPECIPARREETWAESSGLNQHRVAEHYCEAILRYTYFHKGDPNWITEDEMFRRMGEKNAPGYRPWRASKAELKPWDAQYDNGKTTLFWTSDQIRRGQRT